MKIRVWRRTKNYSTNHKILFLILVCAFLVRAIATLWVNDWSGPDSGIYIGGARSFLSGSVPGIGHSAPFYSVFLAGVFGVFGESVKVVQLMQALILSSSVVLTIYVLGKKIDCERAGLMGAGIYAIYLPAILFRGFGGPVFISSEMMYIPLFLASIAILAGSYDTPVRWLAAGLLIAFAALTRPTIVVLPFLLICWSLWRRVSKEGKATRSRLVGYSVMACLVAAFVISPYVIYISKKVGSFALTGTSAGRVLLGGNNPHAVGMWIEPHLFPEYRYLTSIQDYKVKRSAYVNEALKFFNTSPLSALVRLYAVKVKLFFTSFDDRFNWTFAAVLPLAVVGFWLTRGSPKAWLIHLGIFHVLLVCLIFYADNRLRSPAEPFLIVLAGVTISRFIEAGKARWESIGIPIAILVGHAFLYILLYLAWPLIPNRNIAVLVAWFISIGVMVFGLGLRRLWQESS